MVTSATKSSTPASDAIARPTPAGAMGLARQIRSARADPQSAEQSVGTSPDLIHDRVIRLVEIDPVVEATPVGADKLEGVLDLEEMAVRTAIVQERRAGARYGEA
jgi:hypothetical protein